MTTTITPSVPLPPKAVVAEEWQPDGDRFYRIIEGEERHIGNRIKVWTRGLQLEDGHIDDGSISRPVVLLPRTAGRFITSHRKRDTARTPGVRVRAVRIRWSAARLARRLVHQPGNLRLRNTPSRGFGKVE
jgi:hypothetical protein